MVQSLITSARTWNARPATGPSVQLGKPVTKKMYWMAALPAPKSEVYQAEPVPAVCAAASEASAFSLPYTVTVCTMEPAVPVLVMLIVMGVGVAVTAGAPQILAAV